MKLRELNLKDAEGMLEWMHDDNINSVFVKDFSSLNKEDVCAFINNSYTIENQQHYACVDEADNYLGTVSLKNIDTISKNAEYAICFCKKAHGTGVANFATNEILKIAFDELGLNRVYLNVLKENVRANNFYSKFGFKYEGCFKQHVNLRGKFFDLNWYGLMSSEWENLSKK